MHAVMDRPQFEGVICLTPAALRKGNRPPVVRGYLHQLDAMVESMPEADAKKAVAYLNGLSPAEKAAIIAGLAG